jgi:hypothetical protein
VENIKNLADQYLETLTKRTKKSKVYKPYQLTGLSIAELLDDEQHKSLYIKMAKKYNNDHLLRLAKSVAEKESIKNKGAYFMKVFYSKNTKP